MIELLRLLALLAVLIVIFGTLERMAPLHRKKFLRKAFGVDLAYYFLNSLLPKLLLILPLTQLARTAHHFYAASGFHWTASLPLGVRVVLAVVVAEVGTYWGHRWSHEIPWLWRFHAVHHGAEEIDWLVNSKGHPLDLVFTRLCGYIPMYLLGVAQPSGNGVDTVPVLVAFLGTLWGFFIHSNIRLRLGPLEWLVSTPAFHHWHHTYSDHVNKNYAALLPLIDKLFGTLYLPQKAWPEKYGTATPVSADIVGQLFGPLMPMTPQNVSQASQHNNPLITR